MRDSPKIRIDWKARRAEAEALIAAKASLAEIAAHFGCSPNTTHAGLKRLGLAINQDAARDRRVAFMARVGADAAAIAKRAASLKATLARPEIRARRSATAKAQHAAEFAWCPPEYRPAYEALRRKLGSAADAQRILREEIARNQPADPVQASARLAARVMRLAARTRAAPPPSAHSAARLTRSA